MTVSDRAAIEEAYADLDAVLGRIAVLDHSALAVHELLELQSQRETRACAAAAVDHQILAALMAHTTPKALGAKSWGEVLRIRLRISNTESLRQVRHAQLLGPRTSLTGEVLPPVREKVAAGVAAGFINADHVDVIEHFFTKLPDWVDLATRAECEQELVDAARHRRPEKLREIADKRLFLIDQDGPEPDDTEPEPARGITLGKQQSDGHLHVVGHVDRRCPGVV